MTNHTKTYKATIRSSRDSLNSFEKIASKLLHVKVIDQITNLLDTTVFRTTPLLIAMSSAITVGLLLLAVCYTFGYRVSSMEIMIYILILGFVVGAVFEYVRALVKKG